MSVTDGVFGSAASQIARWHIGAWTLPRRLIGPEEIQRVLAAGDEREAEALICNHSVSDRLLEELYERTGACASLPEERWSTLIYLSRNNERLFTREDSYDMPDTGHYGIQHAIFELLAIAPVEKRWLHVLYAAGTNKPLLRESQRNWLKYQESTCKLYEVLMTHEGAGIARLSAADCLQGETLRRLEELRWMVACFDQRCAD